MYFYKNLYLKCKKYFSCIIKVYVVSWEHTNTYNEITSNTKQPMIQRTDGQKTTLIFTYKKRRDRIRR